MQFKQNKFPQEGEIVVCTVKRIQKTTVFVELAEYHNIEGIIHISEISPGRIRTVRDYVKEGKRVICKVLRKNEKYGNLDLSLRRVTTGQRLNKLKEIKLEDKCEKIIESVSKQLKLDYKKTYEELSGKILKEYEMLSQAFQEIAEGEKNPLEKLGIDKKLSSTLEQIIKIRLKPKEIRISKDLIITCKTSDGIDSIKKALNGGIELSEKKKYNIKITYISAPKYNLTLTYSDPREAELQAEEVIEAIKQEIVKNKGQLEVEKARK
ncbi:MAG: S1 RNA-binding domain-containing protein [Nanoarchaeota archaeon]|nr:S1 RNA-binding domain-containing protein [Nanoarchaeota archaeon]